MLFNRMMQSFSMVPFLMLGLAGCAVNSTVPISSNDDDVLALMTVPNAVDSDQDGELSSVELLAAPKQLLALDVNADGLISSNEMGADPQELPRVRSHLITNLIDADGDVEISANEIANASNALKHLDRNRDWVISKAELSLGRPIGLPFFSTRGLSPSLWKQLNGYTEKIRGPILPGENKQAFDGYMLIHDGGDYNQVQRTKNLTYLMDANGNIVHQWSNKGTIAEASPAYLLPNGQLLRGVSNHHWTNDKYFPVGAFSTLQLVDWDGAIAWEYSVSVPEKYSFHHDVEYLPNGNILAIRYTGFTKAEAMAMGWDPSRGQKAVHRLRANEQGMVWLDSILEIQPNLIDGSTEIVWQWNSWEHLVQDKYPAKMNFGDSQNPNKIHVNYLNLDTDIPFNAGQFYHMNSVSYNPELEMIMVSSPTFGEIWFIDHSTTIEEAASGRGGKRGKGGDLLYRWGNNEAFGGAVRDDSTLYWQHDAHWIKDGVPGAGNVLIFNNGSRRTLDDKYMKKAPPNIMVGSYTNLLEVSIPMSVDGELPDSINAEIVWSWQSENKEDFFSPFMSGLQRLPNGNTIFCRAYDKHIIEVTAGGERVLDFTLAGWGRLHRIYKYPQDYSGFLNKQKGR